MQITYTKETDTWTAGEPTNEEQVELMKIAAEFLAGKFGEEMAEYIYQLAQERARQLNPKETVFMGPGGEA